MKKKIAALILILFLGLNYFKCAGVSDTIENIERLKFKLGPVDNLNIAGVRLSHINSLNDLNVIDGAALLASFASGRMPASFTVNLIAKNPDTYPGGSAQTTSIIKSLDWRLLIDNKDIISGSIDKPINVPGVGQQTTIPIPVNVDLLKFFNEGGYESLMNLALAIGGRSGTSSRLTLKIRPTIDTFLGGITYPGEINVVDKEFR